MVGQTEVDKPYGSTRGEPWASGGRLVVGEVIDLALQLAGQNTEVIPLKSSIGVGTTDLLAQ